MPSGGFSVLREVPPKLVCLISELYFGTDSAVRCGGSISDLFPIVTGVRQGMCIGPTLFNTCMDWILGRCQRSSCGTSLGNVEISDLDFADDAVCENTGCPCGGPRGTE